MSDGERPMNEEARAIVARLKLQRLSGEGGYLRPFWTSAVRAPGGREWGSTVYFFVTPLDFSGMHRFVHDEVWHFHAGDPAEVVELDPRDGACRISPMGPDLLGGDAPQVLVPGGVWQAARIRPNLPAGARRGWTLFGCTLAPGWDAKEYELGHREALVRAFPAQAALVAELTNV
jgi:predicted cupin superfamily sugar epimerase